MTEAALKALIARWERKFRENRESLEFKAAQGDRIAARILAVSYGGEVQRVVNPKPPADAPPPPPSHHETDREPGEDEP